MPSIRALNLPDGGGRNDTKFLMSKGRNMFSHEVINFKILSFVSIDLEDLVFSTSKRNKPVTNNILRGGKYFTKVEKEISIS